MSAPSPATIFLIGLDVLKTSVSSVTGFVTAQLGNVVTNVAKSDDAEWWQHVGFASRPRKPEAGKKSAQVVILQRSDHDAVIASHDERAASILSTLDDGETAVFASVDGGAVIVFDKNGGAKLTSGDIKLGDANAVAVAQAAAIADLQTAITNWTPVSQDGGAALKTALVDWLVKNYATTKVKAT